MSAGATALFAGRIFPGMRPFEAEDALLFFGREEQVDELLRRLDDTRFLAVVGLSGSGKSSLVRSGLQPALHRGHLAGASSRWRVSVMRPGSNPLTGLAGVLNQTLGPREDRLPTLRSGRLGLVDASCHGRRPDENLLLVVDQFEEIFRYQHTSESGHFVDLLLTAAQQYEPEYRVYIVLTLRSDYLGECARFRGLPEALNESQYLVPRMTRQQLREAIEGPAALGAVEVSQPLVEELLDRTGDDPDQLSVLQHLLMRMWELRETGAHGSRIKHDQYHQAGGWDDALNKHADQVWNDLGGLRELARRIFQRLTEKSPAGREVRRPATVRDLGAIAEASLPAVTAVVNHFRAEGRNFLTSADSKLTGDSVVDISHEALIRRWKRLNEWATEEAYWGQWYRRVEDRFSIGAHLVDLELQPALEARTKGRWNQAWAERYATERDGVRPAYADVIRFLEASQRKRRNALYRLRLAAVLFAALAAAAGYSSWLARQARLRAEASAGESANLRNLAEQRGRELILAQAAEEAARLKSQAQEAEKRGLSTEAEQLRRSAQAAQMALSQAKRAAASGQQQLDLEYVARHYYVSPYSPMFSSWYSGSWYRRFGYGGTSFSAGWYRTR